MTLGFVFPGQGSQSVGMLKDLANAYNSVLETFAEASSELRYDLWDLVQNGPESELNATEKTQPAMLAAGVSIWRIWQEQGGTQPMLLAGHSLGEYTALVCSGALNFCDAVNLVADRGRYMQEAVSLGTGAMAAIVGLTEQQVTEICQVASEGEVVACANFNSPKQIVIAGHRRAVERAVEWAKRFQAKRAIMLSVSVPSHCELMRPAAERLFARLASFPITQPTIPVIHNVDASIRMEVKAVVQALVDQVYKPVRWVEVVQRMMKEGVNTIIECGPGKVLTGLCRRIDRDQNCLAIFDTWSLDAALKEVG